MKNYETIIVFSTTLGESELVAETAKVQSILESHGAKGLNVDKWGRKEMAYVVKKQKFGNYVVFTYGSDESTTVDRASRVFALTDSVLKFQTHVLSTKRRKVKTSGKVSGIGKEGSEEGALADVEY